MKRAPLILGALSILVLAGCSGGGGPEGADSMESDLQKAAQNAPSGGAWTPRSAGGTKADKNNPPQGSKQGS